MAFPLKTTKKKTKLEEALETPQKPATKPPVQISQAPPTPTTPPQTWQLGNQVFTDKEEYNAAVSAAGVSRFPTGGVITPKVAQAVKEAKAARVQYTPELLSEREKAQLTQEEAAKLPEMKLPSVEETTQKIEGETQAEFATRKEQLGKFFMGTQTAKEGIEMAAGIGKSIFATAAQVYDVLTSALISRKAAGVRKAEASFTDATNIIRQDINLVKTGQKSYEDVTRNFELAIAAISRLERETKGAGKINLNYWLDEGAELETSIITEKAILENLRFELETARITQARAGLGI